MVGAMRGSHPAMPKGILFRIVREQSLQGTAGAGMIG
jgi:hypothetical protein